MKTGNIGEWSEFFAFIKILIDKVLFAAGPNLEKIDDKLYWVLKVIRSEAQTGEKTYDISQPDIIRVFNDTGKEIDNIPTAILKKHVKEIFQQMQIEPETTFSIPDGDELMRTLHCTQIKASSTTKEDLRVIIHDPVTPHRPELGFSIKSQLGSPSTLLNASGGTNFIFEIVGEAIDSSFINAVQGRSKVRGRLEKIEYLGGQLDFRKLTSETFRGNLRMIDTAFPQMVAEIIKAYFQGHGTTIEELVESLAAAGTLKRKFGFSQKDFEFKVKNFLVNVALGMTPSSNWDGLTRAGGGYIVVRKDGEIVCYHLYNLDEFKEYLYKNTKLDTPSTSRHDFGYIYEENGAKFIKLNLQIRFTK